MEFVYVVPRSKLFPDCYPQGWLPFRAPAERRRFEGVVRAEGFFAERDYAERQPELQQIIPYTVVRVGEEILLLRRLKGGGERRLHDKLSIGVGGHINPVDRASGDADLIRTGARREIDEEIRVRGTYELRSLGFLNDDSNPVGAVHVGMVHVADVRGTVEVREREALEGELAAPADLRGRLDRGENFETWSSILIERIGEFAPNPETTTV